MSVAVANPSQVADFVANPDALNTAFEQKVNEDPAGTAKALSDYMKDPATRDRMVKEAQDGLQAIHDIQEAFGRVYALLAQVDAQNFKGLDGKVIDKLAPVWRGYSDKFNTSLSQTETLASQGKALIDTFTTSILPMIQSTTMTADAKKARLDFYANTIDQNGANVKAIDALVAAYNGISNDVSAFKATFEEKMSQVGQKLDTDIQRAKDDIVLIKEKLAQHQETAKKLGIAGGVLGGVGGALIITGGLAPIGVLIGIAGVVLGGMAIDEYFNKVAAIKHELADKEAELTTLESQKSAYQKLAPAVTAASSDMSLIMTKLTVLTQVFKLVKNDIVVANEHLVFSSQADTAEIIDIRNEQIALSATSYANVAEVLNAFASGWSAAVTLPST
ncbi:hypothetical protein B0H11DRAFT_2292515 [Mycena galericulata]|nr:hypothetical protein B0H11DRAFT_2292515 [Mycena galericulata]